MAWLYEPHRFVLARDGAGAEREAFVPDFYLPALGVYLEVCAGSPRRLNRKRAKLRRLAATHPNVSVHLLGPREVASFVEDPHRLLDTLARAA